MANLVQAEKKIAILHRYPKDRIRETNAAFPYLEQRGADILTFRKFNRFSPVGKFFKSLAWIFYAPFLVAGKNYDVIYCDDSFPFYPGLVKMASPKSKVVIRLGDFHLMYYTSGLLYKALHFLEKWAWKKADAIIAISDVMAEHLRKETGRQIHVAFDPVDTIDFSPIRVEPGRMVMFHGLLTKNKNINLLIFAARHLPDVNFVVVGDGPDLKRLMSIAPKNVLFTGWVGFDVVRVLIARCSVGLALRSQNPGNDFVVTSPFLQYGAMGKPCLVTRRAVFGDYPWQFSNTSELVRKLNLLFKSPFKSQFEGEKLRSHILLHHDARKIAEEIWQILLSQS